MAAQRAPGLARTFGFQKLAWFDGPAWQRIKQAARDRIRPPDGAATIFASDIAEAAIARTRANAVAAQVAPWLALERADALARPAPAPAGVLVANPPYGVRLSDREAMAAL